jgi:hypothetical protein
VRRVRPKNVENVRIANNFNITSPSQDKQTSLGARTFIVVSAQAGSNGYVMNISLHVFVNRLDWDALLILWLIYQQREWQLAFAYGFRNQPQCANWKWLMMAALRSAAVSVSFAQRVDEFNFISHWERTVYLLLKY